MENARNFEDVQIVNKTDEMACISIAGPLSRDLLSKLTPEDVSNKSFRFMKCKNMEVAGVPVLALRVSYTGKCRIFRVLSSGAAFLSRGRQGVRERVREGGSFVQYVTPVCSCIKALYHQYVYFADTSVA